MSTHNPSTDQESSTVQGLEGLVERCLNADYTPTTIPTGRFVDSLRNFSSSPYSLQRLSDSDFLRSLKDYTEGCTDSHQRILSRPS